jgi:hypothetical protein
VKKALAIQIELRVQIRIQAKPTISSSIESRHPPSACFYQVHPAGGEYAGPAIDIRVRGTTEYGTQYVRRL